MSSLFGRVKRKLRRMMSDGSNNNKKASVLAPDAKKILLLTNRDSDNVGDQVIEASDISLIKAAMKNLGQPENSFDVVSRAASIIPKKYVETKDEKLETARRIISQSDLVFFGGAPMFNYRYQIFYERTAKTIEIAQEYGKPVVFSAIGVEGYDEDNPKCQRLKKTLNFDIVKRITTRDDFESLQKYKENPNLFIDKVADPAVFSKWVFRNAIKPKKVGPKKVGLFIIRANAFKDNGFNFPWQEAASMWKELTLELENRGYDYEMITSGHFGDEAFIDRMIREYSAPADKCVFNINTPEELYEHMSSYDAIVSCRLHPSIIAFSMGIPSVGLVWNSKVTGFYDSIDGHDRTLEADQISAKAIMDKIEKVMEEGVTQDSEFMMSVYRNIYCGLRDSFKIDKKDEEMWSFDELIKNLPAYKKTSKKETQKKLRRKFRRIYDNYNQQFTKIEKLKKEVRTLKAQIKKEEA